MNVCHVNMFKLRTRLQTLRHEVPQSLMRIPEHRMQVSMNMMNPCKHGSCTEQEMKKMEWEEHEEKEEWEKQEDWEER